MAIITALGFSFNSTDSKFGFLNLPTPISSNTSDTKFAAETTQDLKQIYANPIFINQNCPVTSTRPATGQVYPRGYS